MDLPVDRIIVYNKGKPMAHGRANRLGQVWHDDGTFYDTINAFAQSVYAEPITDLFGAWLKSRRPRSL